MSYYDTVVKAYAKRGVGSALWTMGSGSVWYWGKGEQGDTKPFTSSDKDGEGLAAWFLPQEDVDTLFADLFTIWIDSPDQDHLDARDIAFISALKAHLAGTYLYVPRLTYYQAYKGTTGTWADCPVYNFGGYREYSMDDEDGIAAFLRVFLAGGHFLFWRENIHHNVARAVKQANSSQCAKPSKHSHYAQTSQAMTYPKIMSWPPPKPTPIVCALLADQITVASKLKGYFMQLEGWPFNVGGSTAAKTKHAADFGQHTATLWNISTYGMSPYSEKRGTSLLIMQKKLKKDDRKELEATFKSDFTNYLKKWDWKLLW